MLGIIELATFIQLLDIGTGLAMLFVFIKLYVGKDKSHEKLHKESTDKLTELVVEATKAIVDKNHTDNDMAGALTELTKVIQQLDKKGSRK